MGAVTLEKGSGTVRKKGETCCKKCKRGKMAGTDRVPRRGKNLKHHFCKGGGKKQKKKKSDCAYWARKLSTCGQ